MVRLALVFALALLSFGQAAPILRPDAPIKCGDCDAWNAEREPFKVFGNTYYVGTAGLSSVLIASDRGLILVDVALPQSAPLIDAHIRKLGFKTEDIKLIVNGHAHYDHAGGIAVMQRATGARVAASASGASALMRGEPVPDDPQFKDHGIFPAVKNVERVTDGQTLRVGDLAITAHLTPGHTPGSTTWSWRSCEGARCLDIVDVDSLTAVSSAGFRFTGGAGAPSIVETFRKSIAKVAALPCDIILAAHPSVVNLDAKLKALASNPETNPFIDAQACRAVAANAVKGLDARVAEEAGRKTP